MKRSKKSLRLRSIKVLGRAVGVATAVVIMASGVTFAVLQSRQAKLTGNIIQTATANLQVSADGINFSTAEPGFNFAGLVPGGTPAPQPGFTVVLKNIGDAPLSLKLAVTSIPTNLDNVDFNKVNVILTPSGGSPQSMTLKSLIDSANNGGLALTAPSSLFAGNRATFTMQVSMAADAFSGTGASLNNIDFAFAGVGVSN